MSQIGFQSRPVSQTSFRLPQIQHPLSRLGNPTDLDVTGYSHDSRAPSRTSSAGGLQTGRPLANENSYQIPKRLGSRGSTGSRGNRAASKGQGDHLRYQSIPEGVAVTYGDPDKARLPVFGARADMASRAESMASRVESRMSTSSAQKRLEIDELESILKERVQNSYFELKKKFKDNDPEGKGNVSRDALHRILLTYLGRSISASQFAGLMQRLGLQARQVLSFQEFYAVFRDTHSSEYPRWMDPVQRNWQQKDTMSAVQVHHHLRVKAQQRVKDVADLIPQANPDGSGHILKPEFMSLLAKLGLEMEDTEFEKLWRQYDPDGVGSINGEKLMKTLGISIQENADGHTDRRTSSGEPMRKRQADRQRSLDIETWLKSKFREGLSSMKDKFEELDPQRYGVVGHNQFVKVLNESGLKLEKTHLAEFLARCGVQPTRTDIPYREFLHRFQDRSEQGMAHKILTNPEHRYNRADSPEGHDSTFSALEAQLMNMFQRDFLTLLGTFHKIDRLGMEVLSPEEFRAAIESRFNLELSEVQFKSLMDRVPMDEDGNVKYADFMAQFDTKGQAPSLFSGKSIKPSKKKKKAIGALPRDQTPSPVMEEPVVPSPKAMKPVEKAFEELDQNYLPKRSSQELFKIIKDLMKTNYQALEQAFIDIDEMNTGRLTQEMMYQLLLSFDVDPPISRGEIRDLWKTFITNTDKTLDFLQFSRHFGFSLKSASFPNAKIVPPRKGDSDFMQRSNKLNSAADMLQDGLRAKIDYMWEDLRREFEAMDPFHTGYVSVDEFQDILTELCVQLSEVEKLELTTKFKNSNDNRVNYVELLKPFLVKRQVWRYGNGMQGIMRHSNAQLPLSDITEPPNKGLYGIQTRLRSQLVGDWKTLRRAFKRLDQQNKGSISLPEFRSVLRLANVVLSEEDVYQLMSKFDQDLSGRIVYESFLNNTFPPEERIPSRAESLRKSAGL